MSYLHFVRGVNIVIQQAANKTHNDKQQAANHTYKQLVTHDSTNKQTTSRHTRQTQEDTNKHKKTYHQTSIVQTRNTKTNKHAYI